MKLIYSNFQANIKGIFTEVSNCIDLITNYNHLQIRIVFKIEDEIITFIFITHSLNKMHINRDFLCKLYSFCKFHDIYFSEISNYDIFIYKI